ncbi:MAG: asparagine synthetase [Candidatus Thiodiazotropha sp. (ex Ustalcina ferruginea)]|nr:asparagine synthetase [Candidatus Thiodiazotropha sp. (ex Ustalcina ferruginea)]
MLKRLLILLFLLSMLSACQTLGERQRAQSLQDILRRYEATMRWSSGQQASKFKSTEHVEMEVKPARKDIKVTHYEVVQGPSMLGDMRAVQIAVIQYVFQDSQIVKEITDQQEWLYDEESEMWYLNSPVPVFN